MEKSEIACDEQFSVSHSVFYPFGELSVIFIKFKFSSANSLNLTQSKIIRHNSGDESHEIP